MEEIKLGILASGRGSNFESICRAYHAGRLHARPVCLISDNPDAPVLEKAHQWKVESLFVPHNLDDRGAFERITVNMLRDRGVDLVILAGFMKKLTSFFVEQFNGRILNIHPSLLPSFPGMEAQKQALEYGVKVSGCTVHVVTEEVDAGPILAQEPVRVEEGDTVELLSRRILEKEHELFPRAINNFVKNKLSRQLTST